MYRESSTSERNSLMISRASAILSTGANQNFAAGFQLPPRSLQNAFTSSLMPKSVKNATQFMETSLPWALRIVALVMANPR